MTSSSVMPPEDTNEQGDEVFVFPASFAQQRLWIIDQLEPGRPTYNIPVNFRLTGALDVGALGASLTYLLERHEALRTVFEARDGEPVQVVLPPSALPMRQADLRDVAEQAREARLAQLLHDEANTPFDLSTGPMVRARLVRLTADSHVLALTFHHIAVDGWSIGIVQRELAAAYDAFSAGASPVLPELALQYADYAVWQREWLQGEVLEQQLAHWKAQLAPPLPMLDVPTDHSRADSAERLADRAEVVVSRETRDAIRALARDAGATPFMVLLAAFQLLLSRYAGQDEVIVGTPIAGRTRTELEPVVGFFVNTLALRTSLGGNPTFRQLVDRVRATTLGAYGHADLPFERLVEELQPERDRTRNPIFQALFSLQDLTSFDGLTLRGLHVRKLQTARETAKFDLQILMNTVADGFRGILEYDASLFDAATARQLVAHYTNLLDGIAANPDSPIDTLRLLDAAEWARAVGTGAAIDVRRDRTVVDLFDAQVRRTPNAIAVELADARLTYRELDERASALARRLRESGVSPGVCVGVCIERSLAMVVGVLGVLKAGGAYVPIDPAYPEARIELMIASAGITTVLVARGTAARVFGAGVAVVDVDAVGVVPATAAPLAPTATTPDDLAYVIFTSGSTGVPKGVAMPHAPLVNLLEWQRRESRTGEGERTLQFASLSFDVSFQEMFATWSTGGALVLVDEATRRDPEALLRLLAAQRIERLFLPYIALQHLADAAVASGIRTPSLREVITAGEQLRVTPSVREWFRSMPGCALVNQYGPTESHVITAYALPGAADEWPELPPIGRPITNAAVYVLDRAGQPVPPGVRGELYLGGATLARGYLNAPALTAERFVPDPFAGRPDARMYRSGDLGRVRRDGAIEYLGRADGQTKVRGYRIELGEVESVIGRSPLVAACAATVREDRPGDQRLVAYIVPVAGSEGAVAAARELCRAQLPEFMVPSAIVTLASLPVTPSGKVDRRALPAPDGDATEPAEYAAPVTQIERDIAAIWATVLGVQRVGLTDNFFDLGGHSLLATRTVSRVRDRLGRDVPLRALFDFPILRDFVGEVERGVATAKQAPIAAISRATFRRAGTTEGGGG